MEFFIFLKNLKKLCDEKFENLFKNYEDLMNYLQIYVITMWLINLQIYDRKLRASQIAKIGFRPVL
jgi:hypothetical protein